MTTRQINRICELETALHAAGFWFSGPSLAGVDVLGSHEQYADARRLILRYVERGTGARRG